jgi:aryl-alcohol dehydrogenase-like predicted oxidoreductase
MAMHYKLLGRTGVRVSALCFGTMSFGGDADRDEAKRMFAACRDAGINFFDCADIYGKGRAEEILGELMAGERDRLVITSKCFNALNDDVNARGGSRRHLRAAVEASLKRLNTDRLDVLFMHQWDPATPLEETLRGLEDLVRAGKVVYLGASNYAAWQIARGLGISERAGLTRFDVIQPMYNLVKRQAEVEILPLARAEGLAVITYGPLGGGLLTGKYRGGREPGLGRITSDKAYAQRYREDWVFDVARRFAEFAEAKGLHPASLAVAWVAAHPDVTAPIIGARNAEQLMPSLRALDIEMTTELRAEISALSHTPPPATDRLEGQA